MFVVAVGNVCDGFNFYGPFELRENASEFAEEHFSNDNWVIANLVNPDVIADFDSESDEQSDEQYEESEDEVEFDENDSATIPIQCTHCENEFLIKVDKEGYHSWKAGKELIQDALPKLTASERELLISQTCDDCWTKLFGSSDDEDEE